MEYKRILTVQDISCVGQCSMSVTFPILSVMGHETCMLPTAVLSTHTGGFGKPEVHHMANSLRGIWEHWQRSGIFFDAILVGYLGSIAAIEEVEAMTPQLLKTGGKLIVDPAMADHGKVYSGLDGSYVCKMEQLCRKADVILPNVTEAALFAGIPFQEEVTEDYIASLLEQGKHKNTVILTGVGYRPGETGIVIQEQGKRTHYTHPKAEKNYSGTGDMFAACFTGALLRGKDLMDSVKIAGEFVRKSIESTIPDPGHWYGVKFETVLPELSAMLEKLP